MIRLKLRGGCNEGNKLVIEYLNKALTHELTAVNQYWLHYRLLDDWGFTKLAKKEREESIEEMHHADKLVTRIIFLEGFPNMQHIDPLMIGQNVKEVLECDLKAEYSARALHGSARACRKEEDYVSMDLFEELLADEEGHINFIETQLNLLKDIGKENYGQLNAHSADDVPEEEETELGVARRTAAPPAAGGSRASSSCSCMAMAPMVTT